jgi:hypothetical protein
MNAFEKELVELAQMMQLSLAETVALPMVVETAARKARYTKGEMVSELFINEPLRAYLKTICTEGAKAL